MKRNALNRIGAITPVILSLTAFARCYWPSPPAGSGF